MPIETAADRAAFLDPDEFGVEAAWTVGEAEPVTVAGIFDADYHLFAGPVLEEGIEGAQPRLLIRSADLPAGAGHGNAISVSRTDEFDQVEDVGDFVVVEIKPDGTGMIQVRLQEA